MSITIKDIARESGYAVGTVSRVLNNRPDVSDTAREKIMEVVEKYNFRLNNNAKHLKQQASKSVAIIVKGSQNMFFASILEQMQGDIQDKGFDCLIYYINENDNELEQALRVCKERRPLGILFLGSNRDYFAEQFQQISVPCIMVTSSAAGLDFENLSSVSTDDRQAGYAAIQHLVGLGHRNIGIIGGIISRPGAARNRYEGCLQAFENNSVAFNADIQLQQAVFGIPQGYEAMNALLDRMPGLTAVFAMSDVMAMGAIRAIKDRGLSVPGDISVIGFDGIELSEYLTPKLTTVKQNGEEIAKRSVEILMNSIEHKTQAVHEIVPFYIIESESTKQLYSEENK